VAPKTKVKDENVIEPSRFNNDIIDDFTAAILMSHSLQTDKENLKILLESAISYIGMLGPRVRSERIFKELNISHKISSIYAPTGLDIGATNPEEIALSILAEIKSVFSERTAAHLRERDIPIHSREQAMNFN
jgi:xanthine/CO dehydrogenase XdhC/CoxF family maturation factor